MLVIDAVQDATVNYAPSIRQDLLMSTPRFGTNTTAPPSVDIVVQNVTFASLNSGTISIANSPLTPGLHLSSLSNPSVEFHPVSGSVGIGLVKVWATFTIGSFVQDAVIVINARANTLPVAGGPGNAARFDGVDDFYMAEHLAWPKIRNNALSPITVEFWCWVDEDSAGDRAVFALGGNTEVHQPWVDQFNRLRESGRWHVTVPDATGATVWRVGDSVYQTSTKPFYSGWAHYAFVHDHADRAQVAIYMNGELVFSGSDDQHALQRSPLDFNHMTIGVWTFWSEVYHKGILDDFRVWNYSRTGDEIRRDRFRQLSGSEPNLFAYWTFDSDTDGTVVDNTGRGNHLQAGGCVACEPRFYCQPYHPEPITLGPDSCIPSAKSTDSPYFRTTTCYGGTVCFKGDERQSTHPTLVPSRAPIGGHTFEQISTGGTPAEFLLNGTDPDGDAFVYSIETLPERGLLKYKDAEGHWIPISTAPFTLPNGINALQLSSSIGDGGRPFATVSYTVFDGIVKSVPVDVKISLLCPRGTFLNKATHHCDLCSPGSFSNDDNFNPACTLCMENEFQPNSGQTSCAKCTPGLTYAMERGSAACSTCNSSSLIVNPNAVTLSHSYCAVDFMTDNHVSLNGDRFRSDISFQSLLPSDLDPAHARVLLSTLPQFGKLYQTTETGEQIESFYDYFFSSIEIHEQYVSNVIHASNWLPDRSYNATIGEPDVPRAGTSPRAWAAFDGDNGIADITVQFETALFMTGIVIYENIGGGAVTKIEALKPSGEFTVIWTGDPLPIGLLILRQFQPIICPTNFKTDTLRITVNSLKCSGRNEIDAIKMLGATELKKSDNMLVQNSELKIGYVPPTLSQVPGGAPLGYKFTDSFSYKIQSCFGGQIIASGAQTLKVTLGSSNLVNVFASKPSTYAAASIASIGIAICVISAFIVLLFKGQPIIRASSVYFMEIMLLGMASGFLVLLLTAFNAADPSRIPHFCMVRPFIFSFGFVLLMGSIIVKTGRIVFIFELSKGARVVRVTNFRLTLGLIVMLLIDFGFLFTVAFMDPLKDTIVTTNTSRYHICASGYADSLINFSIAYKCILVLIGLALVIKGRNVPSTFNEVKALSFMAYSIATNAIIYLIISGLVSDDPNASVIIMTFTMTVTLFSTWCILVAVKFFIVMFRPEQNTVNTTSDRHGTGTASRTNKLHTRAASRLGGQENTADGTMVSDRH